MKHGFIKAAAATPVIRVADTVFNTECILGVLREAGEVGVRLLVLPELCVTGYTCGDLFLQKTLLDGAEAALGRITEATRGLDMLVFAGLPVRHNGRLYNCAAALWEGELLGVLPKANIPNYSEFYEKRYFTPGGDISCRIELGGRSTLLSRRQLFAHTAVPELVVSAEICEDVWVPNPPSIGDAMVGATVIVNLSASDETVTKDEYRRELVSGQSARLVCAYLYADSGEGESTQDLVYTGHNLLCENGVVLAESNMKSGMITSEIDVQRLDAERRRLGTFPGDNSGYNVVSWGRTATGETSLTRPISRTPFVPANREKRMARCEKIIGLQSLGLKKRILHTGAKKLVIGVSGGLDSTLAAIVASRALVLCGRPKSDLVAVTMPCFGTTAHTRTNAEILAEKLGAELVTVDITEAVRIHFRDIGHDIGNLNVVFENGQARERTQVLMDIANARGGLVVGTGDLSELALGWATYNGDHMSMYGVNSGVPKTLVRYLVAYTADTCGDEGLKAVLESILATPVSPELLPAENGEISQKTEDLVGPYELHDFFLYYAVRWGFTPGKVYRMAKYAFAGGYPDHVIFKWLRIFYRRFFSQQFKRSCLPDGPKVGTLTLSPRGDWRMPSDASAGLWLRELENMEKEREE